MPRPSAARPARYPIMDVTIPRRLYSGSEPVPVVSAMYSTERAPIYRFGAFEFDGDSYELTRHGETVPLRPQPATVLALLLADPGRVVTREELRARLWGNEINVDYEHGLNSCLSQLRVTLGESAEDPRFVQTVPRRGYRFAAPVELEARGRAGESASGGASTEASATRRWSAVAALVVVFALVAGYRYGGPQADPRIGAERPAPTVLAVLPFRSLTEDPQDRYFGEGLSEELIGRLGHLGSDRLVVMASSRALGEPAEEAPPMEAAGELGADLLLSGTVRRAGDAVRVTSQLVRVPDGAQVWAGNHEGLLVDVLEIQKQITGEIVDALSGELSPALLPDSTGAPGPAYEVYRTAVALYERGTQQHVAAAVPAFEEALAIDPGLGEAWAGLALALAELELPADEKVDRVRDAAGRALEIDPALPAAHVALGLIAVHQEFDLVAARRHFERAVQHAPGQARVHQGLAVVLAALGEQDRAVQEAEQAVLLDPLSVAVRADLASTYYLARRYDEAIATARLVLELEPNLVRAWNGLLFSAVAAGRHPDAREAARRRLVDIGGDAETLRRFDRAPQGEAMRLFWERHVEWVESELPPDMAPMAIPALIQLGEHARALDMLEQAARDGEAYMLPYLAVAPYADPLRDEPRFRALLGQVATR